MRANSLSNRVFKSYDDIVDHCCYAWNTLVDLVLKRRHRSVIAPGCAFTRPAASHK
jgi:hypothetical protein